MKPFDLFLTILDEMHFIAQLHHSKKKLVKMLKQ